MVRLKNNKDIKQLRISGKILAEALAALKNHAREGISLKELDLLARELIKEKGAVPAFLGYKPEGGRRAYPAAICTSVNNVIVLGLPSDYVLREGDILKIDLGVNYRGYFTDAALTVGIGRISKEAERLIKTTENALRKAIERCGVGNHLGDIGWIIEKTAKENGFSVAQSLTGHGVGFELHEDPIIYNYGNEGEDLELKPGMVLAIEPMFALGLGDIKQMLDDSLATADGSLSAHFEHTIAIRERYTEVLTGP